MDKMINILKPIITEKSSVLKANGRYTFKVVRSASKIEIKKDIEKLFGVKVLKVNTVNIMGKKKRFGKNTGITKDWKKAVIFLKDGDKIQEYEDLF